MHIIIYDFGTSSLKTCLFDVGDRITLAASSNASYDLRILENGGAEQDTDEWWRAICKTTKELFDKTDIKPEEVSGLAFCAQMQGVVLVDKNGKALRPAMCYMDSRGVNEYHNCMGKGIVKVSGCSLYKLLRNLRNDRSRTGTGAAAHTCGNEDHIGTLECIADLVTVLLRRLSADLRSVSGAASLRQLCADLDLRNRLGIQQCLRIGIHSDIFNVFNICLNHAVQRISAAAADTDDFDIYLRIQ